MSVRNFKSTIGIGLLGLTLFGLSLTAAEETPFDPAAAERGYRFLLENAYVPPDLNEQIFENLWQVWPEPLRAEVEKASPAQRRQMAFERYGLTPRPGDDSGKPLQYVVDERGDWTMNCFACHGGKVAGRVIPGLPNTHLALQTLMDDVRATKLLLEMPLTKKDLGGALFPYGGTNGTTNAVMFGVALGNYRDHDMKVVKNRPLPRLIHHDMDAPPWWHMKRKDWLYIDGFAGRGHRALMQFMLTSNNGPERLKEVEADFRDIEQYLLSIEPPRYPHAIDADLVAAGRALFEKHCADCHGTYGSEAKYPQKTVPIDDLGTDRVRFTALTRQHRSDYAAGWLAEYGKKPTELDPVGYMAPPLDGVWASAPYLHNGSVPTLWHMLHPDQRPLIWKRTVDGYDQDKVGLEVQTFERTPATIKTRVELREYFDTRGFGKSAAGHDYPAALTEDEKRAVLEYLKTL